MNIEIKNCSWITANWPAPSWVKAGISTRYGGSSNPPFDKLNLALHVGDEANKVVGNRTYLNDLLKLPADPVWLNQTHGTRIINTNKIENNQADGSFTENSGVVCAVLTADCVPLLLCNSSGGKVAAIHVGWRGMSSGIISSAIEIFRNDREDMFVWIGPHISENNYEVGYDVYSSCTKKDNELEKAFTKNQNGRWYANLELMIRHELMKNGIYNIYISEYCTFKHSQYFYSYRRNNVTGRMASMIWIDK